MKLNYSREDLGALKALGGLDVQATCLVEDLLTMHSEAERLRNRILGATWDDDYPDGTI